VRGAGTAESAAIERRLCELCGTTAVDAVIQLQDGRDVYVEARAPSNTCAASFQLHADGTIARELTFTCAPVAAPARWEARERPAVRPLLDRYFSALNDGDFASAAEAFSADCLYVHPPYGPGEPLAEFHGRTELVELWPVRRGTARVQTTIERCVQSGNHAFVEGVAAGGSFLSSMVLDPEGLIARYVAFFTPRRVRRLASETDSA
jgi:SnoaL-like domain